MLVINGSLRISPVGESGGNTFHGRPAGEGLSLRTFSIFRRNLFETSWFQVCGSFAEM